MKKDEILKDKIFSILDGDGRGKWSFDCDHKTARGCEIHCMGYCEEFGKLQKQLFDAAKEYAQPLSNSLGKDALPTDEEIEERSNDYSDEFHDDPHAIAPEAFFHGAKWMRDKIKNESQENNQSNNL